MKTFANHAAVVKFLKGKKMWFKGKPEKVLAKLYDLGFTNIVNNDNVKGMTLNTTTMRMYTTNPTLYFDDYDRKRFKDSKLEEINLEDFLNFKLDPKCDEPNQVSKKTNNSQATKKCACKELNELYKKISVILAVELTNLSVSHQKIDLDKIPNLAINLTDKVLGMVNEHNNGFA